MVATLSVASPADTTGTVAGRVLQAQRIQRYLATADGLRDVAAKISALVADSGCPNVMPASTSAATAVAAAVLTDPSITMCDSGSVLTGQTDKVLVVETVAVSGLRARQAVLALNDAGCNWVGVTVLFPVLEGGTTDVRQLGLDDLDATMCF